MAALMRFLYFGSVDKNYNSVIERTTDSVYVQCERYISTSYSCVRASLSITNQTNCKQK